MNRLNFILSVVLAETLFITAISSFFKFGAYFILSIDGYSNLHCTLYLEDGYPGDGFVGVLFATLVYYSLYRFVALTPILAFPSKIKWQFIAYATLSFVYSLTNYVINLRNSLKCYISKYFVIDISILLVLSLMLAYMMRSRNIDKQQ